MKTFRSLRHRNYRLYFIGQMISIVGSWMQTTALMWLAYDLTHESKWPAFLMVAMIGPTLLLGGWSGSLADRCRKHTLIMRTQVAFFFSASTLATLVLLGQINLTLLFVLMTCHGIIQAIDLPTRLAFVPDLVDREDLINTVALNSVQFNVARAIGPAIAGLLYAWAGPAVCFLINAGSYIAVLIALSMMHGFRERPPRHPDAVAVSTIAVLKQERRIFLLILLAGATAIAGWPLLSLLPAFARDVLHLDERGYGSLLSSVGIGALLAALTAATFGRETRQRTMLIGGLAIVCAGLTGLSQARDLLVACLWCGLYGYGMILFFATGQALVQLGISDEHRGKVMGFWAMMLSGGAPIGNLMFGPAADEWGVTRIVSVQAALLGIAMMVLLVFSRHRPGTSLIHRPA